MFIWMLEDLIICFLLFASWCGSSVQDDTLRSSNVVKNFADGDYHAIHPMSLQTMQRQIIWERSVRRGRLSNWPLQANCMAKCTFKMSYGFIHFDERPGDVHLFQLLPDDSQKEMRQNMSLSKVMIMVMSLIGWAWDQYGSRPYNWLLVFSRRAC